MQLSLNYRGGPLSVEARRDVPEGVTRAGDRAPNAPLMDSLGKASRLFDLYRGPHFTLLALGGAELPALDKRFTNAVKRYRILPTGQGGNALWTKTATFIATTATD
jgi:hypothetical protein